MISPAALRRCFVLTAYILLAACQEDEKSCHDRISAGFKEFAETASAAGHHDRATTALESSLSASVIYYDADRNICDYVTAGPYLERK